MLTFPSTCVPSARRRATGRIGVPAVLIAALAAVAAAPAALAGGDARFRVLDRVVNDHAPPFTATVNRIGAGALMTPDGGGFEPQVWRTRITALEDAPNRIVAKEEQLTAFHVLRRGALDGAEVNVYRIEDGAFRRVRRDRVKEGGMVAGGWRPALKRRRMIPVDAPRHVVNFARFNRPDTPIWFSVRAVTDYGDISPFSAPVELRSPEKPKITKRKTETAPYRPKRKPRGKKAEGFTAPPVPGAPTGLRAEPNDDGSFTLTWRRSEDPGVVGYVLSRSDFHPDDHEGAYLDLEGGAGAAPIRAGDMVILSKRMRQVRRGDLLANRVWNAGGIWKRFRPRLISFWPDQHEDRTWSLAPHAPDTPVEEPGETFLKIELNKRGREFLSIHNNAGVAQHFYPVLQKVPYRMEAWIRSAAPGRVTFRVGGHGAGGAGPFTFRTTRDWKKISVEFTPETVQQRRRAVPMRLELVGPNVFSVDNLRIHRADAEYLKFHPEEAERIRASGVRFLRTHALGKTGLSTYGLAELTNPGGVIRYGGGNTLPQTLAAFEEVGVNPWLQIGMHLSPEEWRGFVEFIAAPFDPVRHSAADRPWAAKRHAQGRAAPWTDAFDKIIFEVANETWNTLFAPWNFTKMTDAVTGAVYNKAESYGLFHDYVMGVMRESPYWDAAGLDEKVETVIGGWRFKPYGADASALARTADHLHFAAYNGGWDEGEGPPRPTTPSFFNVLNQVSQSIIPSARRHGKEAARIAAARGRPLFTGSYEGGPGYALNGLNGRSVSEDEAALQEEVMKSQAGGVAALDSFLAQAAAGAKLQNFYAFGEGRYWRSHARWPEGGQAYPAWKLLSLYNNEAVGAVLATETLATPRADLAKAKKRQAVADAPLTAVYATKSPGRLAVFVISRRTPGYPKAGDDGYTRFTLDLPIDGARSVTLHKMAGPLDAHNVDADRVKIETVALGPKSGLSSVRLDGAMGLGSKGVPPGSALLYVFETE